KLAFNSVNILNSVIKIQNIVSREKKRNSHPKYHQKNFRHLIDILS
ncbi:hypothetical protein ALC62_15437, partial [Cyphomyrmex costatus]